MQITIPCVTFARHGALAALPTPGYVLYDNGVLVSAMRVIKDGRPKHPLMAVEKIGGPEGQVLLNATPDLIEACKEGAEMSADLIVDVSYESQFGVAMTTAGYMHTDDAVMWECPVSEKMLGWRENVLSYALKPAVDVGASMYWSKDVLNALQTASPSGELIFERIVGPLQRPMIINDLNSPDWFAILSPWRGPQHPEPATVPLWAR